MDRRRRRFSPSMSRSPPRHRSPKRRYRRRSHSVSRSQSIVRSYQSQSSRGDNEWTRKKRQEPYHHYAHKRSGSYERPQLRKRHSSNNRHSRRSGSCSGDDEEHVTSWTRPRDAKLISQTRHHSSHVRRQSPSLRRRSPVHHVRRQYTQSRSPTPRRRSPSDYERRSLPRHHSPSPRRHRSATSSRGRSRSAQCPSPSPQSRRSSIPRRQRLRQHSPSPHRYSQDQRSFSPRHCSTNVRRRSRDRRSRSRSTSRRRRSYDARSSSSYGRSSSRNMDRRFTATPVKQSPIEFSTSSSGTSPKTKAAATTDDKQHLKESNKADRVSDEHCLSTTGSHDHRSGNSHDASYGSNHHQLHNIRPLQQDACAPSSSMAMQGSSASVQSIATSDRVTTSFPRGGQSSVSTPTRSTGANGNHHTFSPAVNPAMSLVVIPIVEKKRQAQRESLHAYFKSNSDYNRAEIKYVSIEAELRLAEFWLEIMTKNLEDVGKRIEVHDWNFQKIISQDESNVA